MKRLREKWGLIGALGDRALPLLGVVLMAGGLYAEEVHVYEQTVAGGTTNQLSDVTRTTGVDYTTTAALTIVGYIFTHWTSTDEQRFAPRDVLGRAREEAVYHLYQPVTLTAHYLPEGEDTDHDGVADGYEIYWYGDLDETATSDTDGDGYDFAAELAAGTDPLMDDHGLVGGVVWKDSEQWLYNPSNYSPYVIRCEPEGALFETITEYVPKGTAVTTATYGTSDGFAYWSVDGVVQRDAFGCALDAVTVTMVGAAVEIVARVASGDSDADGIDDALEYYWYGNLNQTGASDSDGDGFTLAQELAAGTSPVMPDRGLVGVVWKDSDEWQYDPNQYCSYVIRSEPEGVLFETQSDIVAPGTTLTTPAVAKNDGFAYWTVNGVRQSDDFGRALDTLTIAAPSQKIEIVAITVENEPLREQMYWYGSVQALDSDTDGDGYTFAQELAAGTDPLMPDRGLVGGVVWKDSEETELNLQPYEQPQGALVDDAYAQLFYSPIAGNGARSCTFGNGAQIWPVVADVNGDGLWDLVVYSASTTNIFINCGSKGNPQFEEIGHAGRVTLPSGLVDMNSTAKLSTMTLDVEPVGALSATTNGTTLLVSDVEGRIWLYTRGAEDVAPYQLQHKVWGGSYVGFAKGLMLAAVDWENDGDLDCLCGTAEGKLMLLRDPKVGRPTGLNAKAGVDSVKLEWDPNGQSRIRGYKVYRADDYSAAEDTAARWGQLVLPSLPHYLDLNLQPSIYGYKVSAMSRFYTAGNSTPTETESVASEPVVATVGGVKFFWNDVDVKLDEQASVMLSIENAYNFNVAGVMQTVAYATEYLKPVDVVPSGLAEDVVYEWSHADGTITIALKSGILAPGSGKFFTLVFNTLKTGKTTVGEAKVTITETAAPFILGDVNGDAQLTTADLLEMSKLCSVAGRKCNANQLKAGDFNGDGKLTMADYQQMRAYFKGKGSL